MSHLDDSVPQDGVEAAYTALPSSFTEPIVAPPRPEVPARAPRHGERAQAPLRRVLEAILFAIDRPVTVDQLLCALPGREAEEVETELERMKQALEEDGCGFRLLPSAGGYQIRTDPEMHEYVTRFLVGKRRSRLSRAAMETLAIIAYRQPITRGECEEVRGVDSGQVLHTLLERNLITFRGRSQALGRPHLYGTTEEFLRYFGLETVADLPSPEELQSLLGEDPLSDPEILSALQAEGFEPVDGDPAAEEDASRADSDATVGEIGEGIADLPARDFPQRCDQPEGPAIAAG